MGFVANFIRFSAVQTFWKSVKIWQRYKELKGGNFFETQYIRVKPAASVFIQFGRSLRQVNWRINNYCIFSLHFTPSSCTHTDSQTYQRLVPVSSFNVSCSSMTVYGSKKARMVLCAV